VVVDIDPLASESSIPHFPATTHSRFSARDAPPPLRPNAPNSVGLSAKAIDRHKMSVRVDRGRKDGIAPPAKQPRRFSHPFLTTFVQLPLV
jgi:hypothetical protein